MHGMLYTQCAVYWLYIGGIKLQSPFAYAGREYVRSCSELIACMSNLHYHPMLLLLLQSRLHECSVLIAYVVSLHRLIFYWCVDTGRH
jgi:hypothetical protein